jgi:hypothetical protein
MKYTFQSINAHKDEIINIESELGVQENRILNLQNSLKCKYYLILDILVTVHLKDLEISKYKRESKARMPIKFCCLIFVNCGLFSFRNIKKVKI